MIITCQPLIDTAFDIGTSDVCLIPAKDIPTNPAFAEFCKPCPSYGRSLSCPPMAMGPEAFLQYRDRFAHALVFKFDIPWEALLSEERVSANRVLHETAAALERAALAEGFRDARGFAAGACKMSFCPDEEQCPALTRNGRCLFPDSARQSLSGMGVDFKALSTALGWQMNTKIPRDPVPGSTGMMAGIVLLQHF